MHTGTFYIPDDFKGGSSSEEYLSIFQGERQPDMTERSDSLYCLLGDLGIYHEFPKNESHRLLLIDTVSDHGYLSKPLVLSQAVEAAWVGLATSFTNSVLNPGGLDLSRFSSFWTASDRLKEVMVGVGEDRWVVIEWYSTA